MKAVIITQYSCDYPHEPLFRYLSLVASESYLIKHPTRDVSQNHKFSALNANIRGQYSESFHRISFSNFFLHLLSVTVTSLILLCKIGPADVIIGCGNWYAMIGIVVRALGLVKSVVYYAIDFVPHQRFSNKYIDRLYSRLDTFVLNHSDTVWNISSRMPVSRRQFGYEYKTPELHVPNVCDVSLAVSEPFVARASKFDRLLFVGSLYDHQGLDHVLSAVHMLRNRSIHISVDIVGVGPIQQNLINQSTLLNIQDSVQFHGFLPIEEIKILANKCSAGVAVYDPSRCKFSQFGDPAKIRLYLSLGLPVITTDVTVMSEDIVRYQMGLICEANPAAVAQAIEELRTQGGLTRELRDRIDRWAKAYEPSQVYEPAWVSLQALVVESLKS